MLTEYVDSKHCIATGRINLKNHNKFYLTVKRFHVSPMTVFNRDRYVQKKLKLNKLFPLKSFLKKSEAQIVA